MEFPEYVRGPLVIEHLHMRNSRCKHIYVVGEAHSLKTKCSQPSTNYLDVVKDYAISHPKKQIAIIYEECFEGMITKTRYTKPKTTSKPKLTSMLDRLTDELHKRKLPDNLKVIFGDARFMTPFDSITALYEHDTVLFNKYRAHQQEIWQDFCKDFIKTCKTVEKNLIESTKSRDSMSTFIRSLLLPSHPYPAWFTPDSSNPIKDMLLQIKSTSLAEYERLEAYIAEHLTIMFNDNTEYSPLMQKVAMRRKTMSVNLEFSKHAALQKFMIVLFSFVLDVYTLCHYTIQKENYDMYIILVGAVHAQNMSRFLNGSPQLKRSNVYRSDERGCIQMSLSPTAGPIMDTMFAIDNGKQLLDMAINDFK